MPEMIQTAVIQETTPPNCDLSIVGPPRSASPDAGLPGQALFGSANAGEDDGNKVRDMSTLPTPRPFAGFSASPILSHPNLGQGELQKHIQDLEQQVSMFKARQAAYGGSFHFSHA